MSYFKTIKFVYESRPSKHGALETDSSQPSHHLAANIVSGEEIKRFYDDLISTPSASGTTVTRKKRRPAVSNASKQRASCTKPAKTCELFSSAEMNNVDGIKKCLLSGIDVNLTDSFGWTALMCSACSGAEDAVRFLLEQNADKLVKNKQNKTAMDIARQKGHVNIVRLLCKSEKHDCMLPVKDSSEPARDEFCSVCNRLVMSTELNSHQTSILHQMNMQAGKPSTTHYGIPDSNTGFQMLLQMGWDRERGFGPSGSGRKFPVKTVLKRDRAGLGRESHRARVTHFEPHDCSAIENPRKRTPSKTRTSKKQRKEDVNVSRLKEIEFRREFY